jgi:23S rRNA pseudouridine955/2504/2580 synthase
MVAAHLFVINGLRNLCAFIGAESHKEPTYFMSDQERKDDTDAAAEPGLKVSFRMADEGDAGQRVDNYLMRLFRKVPKSRIYRLLRRGEVRVNGKRAKPEQKLEIGDKIRLPPIRVEVSVSVPPSHSLQSYIEQAVLFEDDYLIVLNKPAGVAVHGGSGLAHGVIEALRAARPALKELELVHRLDRETSGCLLIAKRRSTLRELHARLRERDMDKRYFALVGGQWTLGTKTLDMPLKTNQKQGGERMVRVHPEGQTALSVFKPAEKFGKHATLMDISIGTGRTHQIRVHAAYAGHPVAGDEKYGDKARNEALREFGLRRMFLHAHSLGFVHPGTGNAFVATAPLDAELESVLQSLRSATAKRSR